ncbi:GYD domain-containing protein [Arthrobacter sp. GCM10027362]|uniref:GYD domain-containing protein n=1 Tax=Arthrobacter sp. GCM10027362 TaxID=3273379 RepID=UPI003630E47F
MTKYLFQANYVGQGIKGLMQEGGSKRREAVVQALESLGGSLDCMYYAFGDTDVLGVFDLPDQASAAALSLMINASGAVDLRLTPLMTPEDLDAATAKTPSYRPPGQ